MNEATKNTVYGERVGVLARLFGCWHFQISRPMTIGKETYCVCNTCGARVHFDLESRQIKGHFYYPPQRPLYPPN